MGNYRLAQICPNGHVVTPDADVYIEKTSKHCQKCGEETITTCPICETAIRGRYTVLDIVGFSQYHFTFPEYCHECGSAYPWTQKNLEAVQELADLAVELTPQERTMLAEDLADVSRDTPRAPVAAERIKEFLAKVTDPVREKIYQFTVDVASSTVVKLIKGVE